MVRQKTGINFILFVVWEEKYTNIVLGSSDVSQLPPGTPNQEYESRFQSNLFRCCPYDLLCSVMLT